MKCLLLTILILVTPKFSEAQNEHSDMAQLDFMVGNWIGTSALINMDTISSEVPAHQKISYDLNKSILIIQHKSESLQLHTIVHYDKKDSTFYYTPYSERGVRKLRAEIKGGNFVVNASDSKRFVFKRLDKNSFTEYGEKLENGRWIRYFEDRYVIVQ